jgi:hypothetical protein
MPRVECAPTCRIINRNYTVYLDESITCVACHPSSPAHQGTMLAHPI